MMTMDYIIWPSQKGSGCGDPSTTQCYITCTFHVLSHLLYWFWRSWMQGNSVWHSQLVNKLPIFSCNHSTNTNSTLLCQAVCTLLQPGSHAHILCLIIQADTTMHSAVILTIMNTLSNIHFVYDVQNFLICEQPDSCSNHGNPAVHN